MTAKNSAFVTPVASISATNVSAGTDTTIQVLIGPDAAPNFALRCFTMQPGGGMPTHTNKIEHEQYVLQGEATVGIGDKTYNVKKGDVVYIPAGVPHYYKTTSKEPFQFLCVVPNLPDEIKIVEEAC